MSDNDTKMVVIAKIGAPYGLDGDMRLNIFCNPPKDALNYPEWFMRRQPDFAWVKLEREAIFQLGNKFLIHLESVSTPEVAKGYVNAEIGVQRDALPNAKENEYYWVDLVGLKVINESDEVLGVVSTLFETAGANDVLVVEDGAQERLIPFVDQYIKSVDFELKQIVVHWQKDY
ncbi:ribosome maturation factor RimM [Thiotrichales bacterium 19S3-7]|nr:ribosome maturation factor RimM [Thiotrichales bacterium 19S3-7]MCF6801776.1 ribosome maturation factor RimM [Thiotrichales bacterium 19S3-11]